MKKIYFRLYVVFSLLCRASFVYSAVAGSAVGQALSRVEEMLICNYFHERLHHLDSFKVKKCLEKYPWLIQAKYGKEERGVLIEFLDMQRREMTSTGSFNDPFIIASYGYHKGFAAGDIFTTLLNASADIGQRDERGWTPLVMAQEYEGLDIFAYKLLEFKLAQEQLAEQAVLAKQAAFRKEYEELP